MATVTKWTPFGVSLNVTATAGTVTRTSATKYTVVLNVSWKCYWSGNKTNYGMSATSGGVTKTISAFGTARESGSASFTGTFSISGTGAQTKSVTVAFKNFNTDNGNAATKPVTLSVSVPAWPTYAVSYNANGGSGAPSSQTKIKGTALKLSTTKPTRAGYSFQGWGTTASDTSVNYAAGATYSADAAITLYAIWKATYKKPTISSMNVSRCDSDGTANDYGTYAKVTFDWSCDQTSGTNNVSSVGISWSGGSATVSASGTSGSASKVIGSGSLSAESAYAVTATVTDSKGGSTSFTKTLGGAAFVLDFLAGGKGFAAGKPASVVDAFDCAFNILLDAAKSIRGYFNGTYYNQFQPINANGNCVLGYGMYNAGLGATNLYGTKFSITSKEAPLINGRAYGENKVLWEAVSYLKSDQTASLNEAISAQPHGVVLVFSSYDISAGTANNYNWHQVFIPKYLASNDASGGYNFLLTTGGKIYHKFLYIHDTQIAGYSTNNSASFSMMGQTVDNRNFVLRKVIGV